MALFREYDLRGIVGEELTEEIAEQVGRAYATMAREQGVARITVGRDGRLSSPGLQRALLRGLLAGGLDVVDLGLCASPLLYFSLFHLAGARRDHDYGQPQCCRVQWIQNLHRERSHSRRGYSAAAAGHGGRSISVPVQDNFPPMRSFRTIWRISKRIFLACARTICMW